MRDAQPPPARPPATTIYRLFVDLPAEPNLDEWEAIAIENGWWDPSDPGDSREPPPFSWPRRRTYLSRASAVRRAQLLSRLGAHVRLRTAHVYWQADPSVGEHFRPPVKQEAADA